MYTFILRDTNIKIPREEFDILSSESWFISNIINNINNINDVNKEIYLYEDSSVFMSIIESIRFKRLIILNSVDPTHMYALCDKWCVPKWLLDELDNYKKNKEIRPILISYLENTLSNEIIKCANCKVGFKKSENTSTSCQYHNGNIISISNERIWNCCNIGINKGCKLGYHVPEQESIFYMNYKINKLKTLLD